MAADLAAAIAEAPEDIATLTYAGVDSLYAQMVLWVEGIFSEATGLFPPSANGVNLPGQTVITNWFYTNLTARDAAKAEGIAPGAAGLLAASAVINAVVRTLSAVEIAFDAGAISTTTRDAVVTLYNATWT